MAQGSRGRTEASVEGLGHLAVPRFVDDTVNRFSPAGGYRNHSERDKCRTQIKHTYQQRCDECTYESGGHTHKDITRTPKNTDAYPKTLSLCAIQQCWPCSRTHTHTHTKTHTRTLPHTHRGGNAASSPELWVKMTQSLVERSNQAFIKATSDLALGMGGQRLNPSHNKSRK